MANLLAWPLAECAYAVQRHAASCRLISVNVEKLLRLGIRRAKLRVGILGGEDITKATHQTHY